MFKTEDQALKELTNFSIKGRVILSNSKRISVLESKGIMFLVDNYDYSFIPNLEYDLETDI